VRVRRAAAGWHHVELAWPCGRSKNQNSRLEVTVQPNTELTAQTKRRLRVQNRGVDSAAMRGRGQRLTVVLAIDGREARAVNLR